MSASDPGQSQGSVMDTLGSWGAGVWSYAASSLNRQILFASALYDIQLQHESLHMLGTMLSSCLFLQLDGI